jgi:D-lactate dehydrogenase (cytochrome)
MGSGTIRARAARGGAPRVRIDRDPDIVRTFCEDAAHFSGGYAAGVATPSTEAEVAAVLADARTILTVGAQSSLTGGATPQGDLILSTRRFNQVHEPGNRVVRVGAGVTLAALDVTLEANGCWYPPAPTFDGAFVGGTISTNAAGAATFKYGVTRRWVRALTVVLATGDVLDLERGATRAHPDGYFDLILARKTVRVPTPTYHMPDVPKVSAGYFSAPGMDLIDLFIGAEGTLGVITEATLEIVRPRPAVCLVFAPFADRVAALRFVAALRDKAREAWRTFNRNGLDVSAIEHVDGRCLALLREDRVDQAVGVRWPDGTEIALLITVEVPSGTGLETAFAEIGRARDEDAPDTPVVRLCRTLDAAHVLDDVEIAVPGDRRRAAQLRALREAVPAAVNRRIGFAKETIDSRIEKTAADMIVPFDSLAELLEIYDREFDRRGLDRAVWGHISDGNLHPNVIPRSFDEVGSGKEAIMLFGQQVRRLGGSPLAEHGVGRNPVKQQQLRDLYGEEGVHQMRQIKRALDPDWKLAPGVLFSQ